MTKKLKSDLGWSTADRIVVRGHDLVELLGKTSLGDFAFLELKGRMPTKPESIVFNAITVTLVEHGMTPSAIAARLTYFGAPESLQGAVAAGLLGIGDRFGGSAEDAARMIAAENGLSGRFVELMQLVGEEASRAYGRDLPVNATGAIGAIASELGIPWRVCRGLAVMARAIGLVAHLQEEMQEPLAAEIWSRIEGESSSHQRPGSD